MTIFSPRPPLLSTPYSKARRPRSLSQKREERESAGERQTAASGGIPFCPPSWKQLENGCGMLGDRERESEREKGESEGTGKKKVLAAERASERTTDADGRRGASAARPKLMPSKFSLILLYLAEGSEERRDRGRRGKPSLRSHSPPLLFYPQEKPTDQWRFKKIF